MTDSETIARLEAKIHTLETRLQVLEDIEEIKKLQRIYGYYLDKAYSEGLELDARRPGWTQIRNANEPYEPSRCCAYRPGRKDG